MILVIVSTFFPDTKNLTATYNKETKHVEQIFPINLNSKNDRVADFTIHYQNKNENDKQAFINYNDHITLKMDLDTFEDIVKAMSNNKEVIIEKKWTPTNIQNLPTKITNNGANQPMTNAQLQITIEIATLTVC